MTISESELAEMEECPCKDDVPGLVAEVRRLAKERDWLAGQLANEPVTGDCPPLGYRREDCNGITHCFDCWREAAQQAVTLE